MRYNPPKETYSYYLDPFHYEEPEQNIWKCELDNDNRSQYLSVDTLFQDKSDDDTSFTLDTNTYNRDRPELIEDWKSYDIMGWVIDLYEKEGISYDAINMHMLKDCTGSAFINYPVSKFLEIDQTSGRWLHMNVMELATRNKGSPKYINQIIEHSKQFNNNNIDNEIVQHKKRGRPKSLNTVRRRSEHKTGRLWEFLRDMLLNPEYCPSLICWENHDEGIFKFVCSDKVAKIWGSKRGNTEMNYEKLSRAMRYYYKSKVLQPVLGRRLVYKFGPNAKGWRTSNPNFELK